MEGIDAKPTSIKTSVRLTGITNLLGEQGVLFDNTTNNASTYLAKFNELSNDQNLPAEERLNTLLSMETDTLTCLSSLSALGRAEIELIPSGEHHIESNKLLQVIQEQEATAGACFTSLRNNSDSLAGARTLSGCVLTSLENLMGILASSDKATMAAIVESCAAADESVNRIAHEIFGDGARTAPADVAKWLAEDVIRQQNLVALAQQYSAAIVDLIQRFTLRSEVLATPEDRTRLMDLVSALQNSVPALLYAAQGQREGGMDAVRALKEQIRAGKALCGHVPRFSARLEAEFIGGSSLSRTSAELSNAVSGPVKSAVASTARAYAVEVSGILDECRAIGIDSDACDDVHRALADVIRLAKQAALSGSAEDIDAFNRALAHLNELVAGLPHRFSLTLYEDADDIFNAAQGLVSSGLKDLVSAF